MATRGEQEKQDMSDYGEEEMIEASEMRTGFSSWNGATKDLKTWASPRLRIARVLRSTPFEIGLGVLISISFLLVVLEAEYVRDPPKWLGVLNGIFLAIYMAECALRIYVLRCDYFCSAMNMLDLFIVVSDLVGEIIDLLGVSAAPSLVVLRILRLLRLTRSLKIMMKFPQLALLMKGLAKAIPAVFYGLCMLLVFLLFWSVCAVHFIHPINERITLRGDHEGCSRCGRAFESVSQSTLTFVQQIVAGDSWGQVTIPIIEESPVTAVFFTMVFISISLSLLNVILAVIVDSAMKTSAEDEMEIVKAKQEEFNQSASKLKRLCRRMDEDGSGDLTAAELLGGYDNHEEFRNHLLAMDIKRDDMNVVFTILDADGSGTVQYDEFISELHKMKSHDSHTLLIFIRHYVTEIRKDLREQIGVLKKEIQNKKVEVEGDEQSTNFQTEFESAGAEGPEACFSPAVTEEKDPKEQRDSPTPVNTASPAKSEISSHVLEELRDLRSFISEKLVCGVEEISQKAENQANLLASMVGDTTPARRGDDGCAAAPMHFAGAEDRRLACGGRGLPPPSMPASAAGGGGGGLAGPYSDGGAATFALAESGGMATLSLSNDSSEVPPGSPSAWRLQRRCAEQQMSVTVHMPSCKPGPANEVWS